MNQFVLNSIHSNNLPDSTFDATIPLDIVLFSNTQLKRFTMFTHPKSRETFTVLAMLVSFALPNSLSADVVIDSGQFKAANTTTGSFVVATSNFSLTAADISNVEMSVNFSYVDDGAAINVNGTSLFSSPELSQYGPLDFLSTAAQPNDIENPWSTNNNGVPRLSIVADASGTNFSGSVNQTAASAVVYDPIFTVANFQSLLQSGTNTIEIINLNGFEGAETIGDYTVCLVEPTAVPEPQTAGILLAIFAACNFRRRRK